METCRFSVHLRAVRRHALRERVLHGVGAERRATAVLRGPAQRDALAEGGAAKAGGAAELGGGEEASARGGAAAPATSASTTAHHTGLSAHAIPESSLEARIPFAPANKNASSTVAAPPPVPHKASRFAAASAGAPLPALTEE